MKKVLFKLVLTACAMASLAAVAQTASKSGVVSNPSVAQAAPKVESVVKAETTKNYIDQRNDLIKKFGVSNAYSMGWYTGNVDTLETRDLWNNYTILSNYLSEKLGRLIVLETDKSDREIASDALSSMDIVYTSAVMGAELMQVGWKPVVGRSENIQGVILVQDTAKADTTADLKKLKIYGVKGATVTYFTVSAIIKNNVYKQEEVTPAANNPNFRIVNTKQSALIDLLKNKDLDGVIVRETLANNLIKANPGKYKVAFKGDIAPGHIIFVSPSVNETIISQLKESFLALNPEVPYYKKILSGLDGYQANDKKPFKIVNAADVEIAKGVLASTGEKPLK